MQKRLFLKNTLILTATAFILRAVGIFFRIYLSNVIGAEGMGIYQLIFSVYTLMSMLCSAGFNISVTKLVSAREEDTSPIMKLCFKVSIILSLFFTVFFIAFSDRIAAENIGYAESADCIRLLSAGLIFISLSACLKGYFTAIRKVSVNSNSQLFEQAVRMGICFALLLNTPHSDIYACCRAVVLANVISEIAAFAFLYISYKKRHLISPLYPKKNSALTKSFMHMFLPVTVSSYLNSFLHTAENLIVPDAVFMHTLDKSLSVSLFGMIKGMAIPVIFFPASFLSAVSTLLLPEISSMSESSHTASIKKTISLTVHITLLSSIGIAALFFVCAYDIANVLYNEPTVGYFLRVLSVAIPFMYTESIIAGTLSALDLHIASLKFNILNSIVRISLIVTLVPIYGIDAFLYIMLASNIFTSGINFIWLWRKTHFDINPLNFFFKPALAAAIAVGVGFFINAPASPLISALIRGGAIIAVYLILILLFKSVNLKKSLLYCHIRRKQK